MFPKVNNPIIDSYHNNYISQSVSNEEGFLEFLKKVYSCPFEKDWDIVFNQCFDYWMKSKCDVWNDEILYNIMCIVTKVDICV